MKAMLVWLVIAVLVNALMAMLHFAQGEFLLGGIWALATIGWIVNLILTASGDV